MITVVHDKYIPAVALNDDARMVLGQRYFTGKAKPNYPMPAIRYRTVSSLINLGYVSALNDFDIDVVFDHYIKE